MLIKKLESWFNWFRRFLYSREHPKYLNKCCNELFDIYFNDTNYLFIDKPFSQRIVFYKASLVHPNSRPTTAYIPFKYKGVPLVHKC